MRCLLLMVMVATACVSPAAVDCEFGTCPAGTVCEPKNEKCVLPEQLLGCEGAEDGTSCTIATTDDGICKSEVCLFKGCGDGILNGPEQCDGDAFPAGVADCRDVNFYQPGTIGCNDDCTYDTSMCTESCGDNTLQSDFEICEIGTEPTRSCVDYGYGAGVLQCRNCGPNADACVAFDWTIIDTPAGTAAEIQGHADDDIYAVLQIPFGLLHDDGTGWKAVDVSMCGVPSSEYVQQLWTPSPGLVFAASNERMIRLDGAGCTTWPIAGHSIFDLFATSASDAWAVVDDGVYHFDGTGWTRSMTTSGSQSALGIWGSSATNLYVFGGDTNGPLVWHYTGASWPTPTRPPSIDAITSIWGTSPTDIYFGGSNITDGAVVLRYNGSTYTKLLGDQPLFYTNESYVQRGWTAGGRVYVSAGDPQNSAVPFPVLVNDGTGWVSLAAPTATVGPLWASASGTVVMNPNGFAKLAIFDGSTRVDHTSTLIGTGEFVARAPDDVFMLQVGNGVYHWDGGFWDLQSGTDDVSDIHAASDGALYGLSPSSGLLRYNAGSWTVVDGDIELQRAGVLFARAANDVYVIDTTTGDVIHWTGTGNHASLASYPMTDTVNVLDVQAFAATDIYIFGSHTDGSTIAGYAAHFNGTAWTEIPPPAGSGDLTTTWARSATDIYAIDQQDPGSRILRYLNGTWSEVTGPWTVDPVGVWGTATETFVASPDALMYHDGMQWSPVDLGSFRGAESVIGAGDTVNVLDTTGGWHQIVRLRPWPTPM
jgi:hypothetical protein